jgi:hypothetical protein
LDGKFGNKLRSRKEKLKLLTFLDSHIIVVRVDEDILLWVIKPVKKIYVGNSKKLRNG